MKTIVIYHRADFDGLFCREIAKKFLPHAELIGWDFGDAPVRLPAPPEESFELYILDLPIDRVLGLDKASSYSVFAIAPNIIWIDHHKSSIESHASDIPGYRIDGVAACRLAWQWFSPRFPELPLKQAFVDRTVIEPLAVRLAGEYDIWDKRDPDAELFQHGLRSQELNEDCWRRLLVATPDEMAKSGGIIMQLLKQGRVLEYVRRTEYAAVIEEQGFTVKFEGLTFLACNSHELDIRSHLFEAGIKPEHEGLVGFTFNGTDWRVSLYGVPGKPDVDLSKIAVKYGGGGHKQACGFRCDKLPFLRPDTLTLTLDQIKDLAEFSGLRVEGEITDEDKESEITITTCPKQGIEDDDGSIIHYRHIAYWEEYPEEGVCPLGQKLVSVA